MIITQKLTAYGHRNIRATHPTTLEITKEKGLTGRGDCIIAVGANRGAAGLDGRFKEAAKNSHARLTLTLRINGMTDIIRGRGDPGLTFTHPTDLVIRKSRYVCPRTLMVDADKAARDIRREIIRKLRKNNAEVSIEIAVET